MLAQLLKFLQLKRYQYEVTFSLYMLTPMEKIIFNTFIFIALSLLIIAVSFYLPRHVATIASRAWWYYAGEEGGASLAGSGAELYGSPTVRMTTGREL